MKKLFSILTVTLISLFAFTVVHAEKYDIQCNYNITYSGTNYNLVLTISHDGHNVDTSLSGCAGGIVESIKIDNYDKCPSQVYFSAIYDEVAATTYCRLSTSDKGEKRFSPVQGSLVSEQKIEEGPTCKEWSQLSDDIKNRYNSLVSESDKYINLVKDSQSIVTYYSSPTNSGEWLSKVGSSQITCDEINNYNMFYKSKMNQTGLGGSGYLETLPSSIGNLLSELHNADLCDKTNYSKLETNLANLNNIIQSTDTAINKLDKLVKDKNCNVDLTYAKESIKRAVNNSKKVARKAFLWDVNFKFQNGCAIIGGDFKEFLNTILFYIKIIAIVLAVILSLLDYIKAAAGSDDKPMTAANKRFITRLILVIVLFLLPVILTFVLNILHINNVTGDSIQCLELEK